MDCIKVSQNLHHYLDGELGRLRRQAVARHLHSCLACSAGFGFEAQLRQMIPAKCRDEAPAHLEGRILSSLEGLPLHGDDFRSGSSPLDSD